ncbi:MAG: asparagine synthase (glutamine-hydrolyzing) [Desulfarculales bacterium]|jgi:asparagine synthase (glutamine-hydrolysing)|nr:asparagine synthase (glutamine-hydrolyzing) [Desulfarculales bacterium]
MCGIAGFFNLNNHSLDKGAETVAAAMAASLRHRGPDAAGMWLQPEAGIALGHTRLSIQDPSPGGDQPMVSSCGRFVISYNGEIYNSAALKKRISQKVNIAWRGHSDTEVLLEACAVLGIAEALNLSNGMFAFALWDKKERTLFLARDRMGVKPLYWGKFGAALIFASELKAFKHHPAFIADISLNSLAALMHYCFIPDPHSIFNNVYKLEAGHYLKISAAQAVDDLVYWDVLAQARWGAENRVRDFPQALDELHFLLKDAVSINMASDVPLGALLSGGVDSSLIVALMQEASARPVRTFSIGFAEQEYNEAPFAKEVANYLGTDHTELYLTYQDALDVIPELPAIYDEPFADVSQIPTFLVSRLTRRHVTVALSGDGGDELFGGYPRYFRKVNGRGLAYLDECMHHWQGNNPLIPGGSLPAHRYGDEIIDAAFPDDVELRQFLDTNYYLPSDILVKVDRAGMAVSLEVRPPLLDHRVFAFAWRMPPELRRASGINKYPLRYLLDKYIPRRLTDRPKMGFGVPIDHWLRGPLRAWAEDLLRPERIKRDGFFNSGVIARVWRDFLAGQARQYWLWDVLMFQTWLDYNKY